MAGGVEVRAVDPGDEAAWADWYGVLDASLEDERPGEPHWTSDEQRALSRSLVQPGGDRDGVHIAAYAEGRAVGAARLSLPLRESRDVGFVLLHVAPPHRRRGVGRALLDDVVARARARGRRTLISDVDEPPGRDVPGPRFAREVGATCALRDARRDLALPPDPDVLDRLEQDARSLAAAYGVVSWRDRTPEAWQEQRALLSRRMSSEVDLGDLPLEEEDWDVPRLVAWEDGLVRQGRTWFTAAAEHDGRLVAFTDVGVPLADPRRAYQWSTLVLPEHRGHRLGTLVKVAVLRALVEAVPQAQVLSTWNAEGNAPMIAVNEALGFRPAGALSEWVLEVGA